MTRYRLLLQFAEGDSDDWVTVSGRIFETNETEERLDQRIRDLESAASAS